MKKLLLVVICLLSFIPVVSAEKLGHNYGVSKNEEKLDIEITQTDSEEDNGKVPALIANIPIKDLKSPRK